MSYETDRQSIFDRLDTEWAIGNPVAPVPAIAWPNRDFVPLDNTAFLRVDVLPRIGTQTGVCEAHGVHRTGGMIALTLHVPTATGSDTALQLADHACGIFRGVDFDNVHCRAAHIEAMTVSGPWFVVSMTCAYDRWEWFDDVEYLLAETGGVLLAETGGGLRLE